MRIKTPTEFLTFTAGRADVWTVANNRLREILLHRIPFGYRTVTDRRYYTARASSEASDRVIQTPYRPELAPDLNVVIGSERYKIERVQELRYVNPPTSVLTLRRIGVITDG